MFSNNIALSFSYTRKMPKTALTFTPSVQGQCSMPIPESKLLGEITQFIKENDKNLYLIKKITIESRPNSMIHEVFDNIKNNKLAGLIYTVNDGFEIELYNHNKMCLICGECDEYRSQQNGTKQHYVCKNCGEYMLSENSQDAIVFSKKLISLINERYLVSAKIKQLNAQGEVPIVARNQSGFFRSGNDYIIFIEREHVPQAHIKNLILGTNDFIPLKRKQKLINIISYFLTQANENIIGYLISKPLFSEIGIYPSEIDGLINYLVEKSFLTLSKDKFEISLEYIDCISAEKVYNVLQQQINGSVTNNFNASVDQVNIGDTYKK